MILDTMKITKITTKITYKLEASIKHKLLTFHIFKNFNLFISDYTYVYVLIDWNYGVLRLSGMIANKTIFYRIIKIG